MEESELPLTKQLVLTEAPKRISRDEMNLAEFPLTVLSTRTEPNQKTLEFKDSIRGKNGEVVERKWIITGADKFGLPTASDDEVLLGLLKLSVDEGMRERKVFFTRYELLRTLKWTTEGRSYIRLQRALDRLTGVRIKATNSFYDNEHKVYSTKNFGIVDAYEINDGRDPHLKNSFFAWSDVMFKSFQVGFIKKLDLDFYLDLESAVSKRLYRYLDKHFWYKSRVHIDLFTLAHEKIGISRNYRYASSIRQILDPAVEELQRRGFLSGCEYIGKGKYCEVVLTAGKARTVAKPALAATQEKGGHSTLEEEIRELLIQRGLKDTQAAKLVLGRSEEVLRRMSQIISYYDFLVASGSRLVSRSPVGFLYRAIETPENFVLPGEAQRRASQASLDLAYERGGVPVDSPLRREESTPRATSKASAETQYLVFRRQEISRIRGEVEPELLSRLRAEVEVGLRRLQGLISAKNFEEAISHGIDEKLAKLFMVPTFDEWAKRKPSH